MEIQDSLPPSVHFPFGARHYKFLFSARHSISLRMHPLTVTTTIALAAIKGYRMVEEEDSRINNRRPQVPRVQPRWEIRTSKGLHRRLKRLSPTDECVRRLMAAEAQLPRHHATVFTGVS